MKINQKSIIFFIFFLSTFAFGQYQSANLFGSTAAPSALDTLTAADSISTGRAVEFTYKSASGAVTVWGYARKLTGTNTSITVEARMLHGSSLSPGPWHSLTAIAESDSIAYEYPISRESWWGYCRGIQLRYTLPDASAASYEIKGVAEIK